MNIDTNNIVIVFKQNDLKTTLVVRSKNGIVPSSRNYNVIPNVSLDNTLKVLGLERVPFNELLPGYKKIKECGNDSCYICYELYKLGEYKRSLHCGHHFHKKCIDKWLKTNVSCPLCRNDIFKN